MQFTLGIYSIFVFITVFFAFLIPTIYILYKFPRIKGIIVLMIVLLVFLIIFLIFIEIVIMSLPFEDINIGITGIPINLIISFLLLIPIL